MLQRPRLDADTRRALAAIAVRLTIATGQPVSPAAALRTVILDAERGANVAPPNNAA